MKNDTFIPVHTIKRYSSNKEKKKIVINSIIDLISLGYANKLYILKPLYVNFSKYNLFSKVTYKLIRFSHGALRRFLIFFFEKFLNHNKKNNFSGYSMLALFLNKNKHILKSLINV
jgi:anaerobic ribonucleoside-triphosphate reductase